MTSTEDALNVLGGLLGGVEIISEHRHTLDPGKRVNPASALEEAIDRAASTADYGQWLDHTASAGGCVRPIQLRGESHVVSERTGRIISTRHTDDMPDRVIYKACGNRRAAVCPSCAETYRADTYQLVLAGLRGGKGIPDTVAQHPCAFVTFTAPSFGAVHSARKTRGKDGQLRNQVCRPRRNPDPCPHGIDQRCHQTHRDDEKTLGTPFCLDCYDHDHQVVWNALSGELWRRTMDRAKDTLRNWAKAHGLQLKLSYGKVAEMQARGVAHFHALIRLDGVDPIEPRAVTAPHLTADYTLLAAEIRRVVATTRFRSLPHPDNPDGWVIAWGNQLDLRPVRQAVDGVITETAVAGYLAKYATKAAEATGHSSARLTNSTIRRYADQHTHAGRLVDACWRLGRPGSDLDPDEAAKNSGRLSYRRLQRWAHMLGFGGHFSTKSRQYSTTLKALREARSNWRRERHRTAEHTGDTETTLIVGNFTYANTGWRTIGDALLANTAAAKAREHRRLIKELIAESNDN
ncbi:replication initiator [Streptomyces sp. SID13031]|uniref:replication initiator n=1 Tax=Streptomyces sp. SID13031 TaxID=2706046 RepID=UPI0013C657E5|nr:replication initiator [Streptomyces sp. SID13031]NEA37560.1 plasmid replication initiator protein [Streptomyces sp. SID13031]